MQCDIEHFSKRNNGLCDNNMLKMDFMIIKQIKAFLDTKSLL